MLAIKSPFYVIPEFVSPLLCEDLIDTVDFIVPDQDKDGKYVPTAKTSERAEEILYERLWLTVPELQAHFKIMYKGMERIQFEWFTEDTQGKFVCENSEFVRGKWLRTKQRDLTAVLFMSDFQDVVPFDGEFEVLGGKLEFAQHHFSFQPQRGTLVVYPSDPHFINVTSRVLSGNLFQARVQIAAQSPLLYDPAQFPGDYTTWFSSLPQS